MSALSLIYHVTFWACAACVLWSCMCGCLWLALGLWLMLAMFYWLALKHMNPNLLDCKGRHVLITGCDTGFGHDLALKLSQMGADVIAGCYDINGEGAKALRELGRDTLHVIYLDVTSDLRVEECCQRVTKICGGKGLWGVVNNAGINDVALVEFTTLDMFRSHLDVNFLGAIRVVKTFLPLVRKAKGRIVNVTSVHGRLCIAQYAAYDTTKFALEAFSDVLRLEMMQLGVKVIVVEPGCFGGGTGIGNAPATVARRKKYFQALESSLSEDLRACYGEDYCSKMAAKAEEASKRFALRHEVDISPVVNAMTHALFSPSPRIRYLVDGISHKCIDLYCILIRLSPYVPTWLMDRIVNYRYPPPLTTKS